jgi:predicted regulator of Ras-like GTPase activity (Roadblock/LC7/MglB family)
MHEVLLALNRVPGILGSLVATTDGMVVVSKLKTDLDEDAAAALVSSLLSGTMALLDECGRPRMDQLVLRASRGKIIVTDLGHSYLVVVTDRNLDLNQGLIEIKSAAQTLRRLGCLSV